MPCRKELIGSLYHHMPEIMEEFGKQQYQTFFNQTEAILNSWQLCYRIADVKTYVAISPAHLIIGRPLLTAIEGEPPFSTSANIRYALRETIFRTFWSSGRADYLNQLQAKFKWRYPSRNFQKGVSSLLRRITCHLAFGLWLLSNKLNLIS